MLGRWKHCDNPLDGLRCVGGVNRGEDLMSGVGGAQGNSERFHIAKFADENDVRILAKGLPKGLFEAGRVGPDFELCDQRELGCVKVFNRIFNGDDFAGAGLVDQLDHRR